MKVLASILCITFCSHLAISATYTFHGNGNNDEWENPSNWDTYPGTTTSSSDMLIIDADLTVNSNVTMNGNLQVNANKTFEINWSLNVNGTLINEGIFKCKSQLNLTGITINNGEWEVTSAGTLIVGITGNFLTNGLFENNGFVLGYVNSRLTIKGDFVNNDDMTINSIVNIDLESSQVFTIHGFCQFNGPVRLEGELELSQSGTININPSSLLTVADNSLISNEGLIRIYGDCHLSSQLNPSAALGNIIVSGNVQVKDSIPKIL